MKLEVYLIFPQTEDMARLERVENLWKDLNLGISYRAIHVRYLPWNQDIIPSTDSSFENRIDLATETNNVLTNAQLRKIADENNLEIPETLFGRLRVLFLICRNDEPLIFYPQKSGSKEITIEDFLKSLKRGQVKSIASKVSSEVLKVDLDLNSIVRP